MFDKKKYLYPKQAYLYIIRRIPLRAIKDRETSMIFEKNVIIIKRVEIDRWIVGVCQGCGEGK